MSVKEEELNKSIDALIDDLFAETAPEAQPVEKSIDIAKDADTTADAATNKAPKAQKDEARGAGRPAQISDVPQIDTDGRREAQYDAAITERDGKEEENEEAKKQAKTMDQVQDKDRSAQKPKAPASAPFKKSEDTVEISKEEFAKFEAFKKSQAEESEQLRKAEFRKEQEELIKSAVQSATESFRKSFEALQTVNQEQAALLKSMSKQPVRPKSVTGIEQLEKSLAPEDQGEKSFSKSEILDAAEELVMKGRLPDTVVAELQMTGRLYSAEHRATIETFLQKK